MKIPRELQSEVRARHAQGQTDAAISDWLAHLDPPIRVLPDAIRKQRARDEAKGESWTDDRTKKTSGQSSGSFKPSGAENRRRLAQERAAEGADGTVFDVSIEPTIMNSHRYAAEWGMAMLEIIRKDAVMTSADKSRHGAMWVKALSSVRMDAEIEKEMEEARKDLEKQRARLAALRQELAREEKRLKTMRQELEAARPN